METRNPREHIASVTRSKLLLGLIHIFVNFGNIGIFRIKGPYLTDLPSGNPVMNIEPAKVEIGKKITARCYSPGSEPPANLTWFINDDEVRTETFFGAWKFVLNFVRLSLVITTSMHVII